MAHEELIERLIRNLNKATARQIGEILHARGLVSSIESGDATCRRTLNDMVTKGELKKENSCYMLPHLSGYGEHDRKLTEGLMLLLKNWECVVYREHTIEEVGLRVDSIVFVDGGDRHACLIVECVNTETDSYLLQKVSVWQGWKNSLEYLGDLMAITVPYFVFCTYGRQIRDILTLDQVYKIMEG